MPDAARPAPNRQDAQRCRPRPTPQGRPAPQGRAAPRGSVPDPAPFGRPHPVTNSLVAARVRWLPSLVSTIVLIVLAAVLVVTAGVAAFPRSNAVAATNVVVFTVPAPYEPDLGNASAPSRATVAAERAVSPAGPSPAQLGNWTAARGAQIADRALRWLSWPYSFAAGNAAGPTYGTAVDADSRNDGSVRGFDCSGLVLYAVAPWLRLNHDAATQYTQAGTFHPALDALEPGDLIFWSKDGTIAAIGHVAIYVGDGKVVQAPHSGAYVNVVPINQVEPGRIGVTRPLT